MFKTFFDKYPEVKAIGWHICKHAYDDQSCGGGFSSLEVALSEPPPTAYEEGDLEHPFSADKLSPGVASAVRELEKNMADEEIQFAVFGEDRTVVATPGGFHVFSCPHMR